MMELFSYLGIGCLYAFALLLFRIAQGHWWCRYGREALLSAASFMAIGVALRLVATLSVISADTATVFNGCLSLGFFALLAQLIFLHQTVHERKAP